jgi:hypothetical protein
MGITIGMTRLGILDGTYYDRRSSASHIGRQCACWQQPPCLPEARALRAEGLGGTQVLRHPFAIVDVQCVCPLRHGRSSFRNRRGTTGHRVLGSLTGLEL